MTPPLGGDSGQFLGRSSGKASAKLFGRLSAKLFAMYSGRFSGNLSAKLFAGFFGRLFAELSAQFLPGLLAEFPCKLLARFLAGHFRRFLGRFSGNASPQLFPPLSGHASATFRRRLDFVPQQNILEPPWEPFLPQWWLTLSSGLSATARSSCPATTKENNYQERAEAVVRAER